jgi:hypothetical protein
LNVCVAECPLDAIYPEDNVPEDQQHFIALNAELAKVWPMIDKKKDALPDADKWAKVPDNEMLDDLLHGEEEAAHGDKAYTDNEHNLLASDPQNGPIWCMPFKKPSGGELPDWKRDINRRLASLRAIVEFPFRVVKRQFRFTKVRYRGSSRTARR